MYRCRRRLWASPSPCCFLLVITFQFLLLSHHLHLALAAPLPTRSSSSEELYSIAWSDPAPGDGFGSGETIVAKWQVTPQNQKVVSPSFRFCMRSGGDNACGATIWPEVIKESEQGSYYVSLTAPSVTTESVYCIQMKDDFDHTFNSPNFNITSTPQKKNKPAAYPPDMAQPRPDQAPMSSSPSSSSSSSSTGSGSKSKGPTDSDPNPNPAVADSNGILSPPASLSSPNPPAAATSTPVTSGGAGAGGNGNGNGNGNGSTTTPSPPQVAAAAHNAPPAAAIAVPLSLTGVIILLAGGLALHHRKQLAAEKERASSWSSSSSESSWPWLWWWSNNRDERRSPGPGPGLVALGLGGSSRNVEKAFFANGGVLFSDKDRTSHDMVYHHHHHHRDRRFPEKAPAVVEAASSLYHPSYAPSSYAYNAPEPRQRTRELDLRDLTREFTTTRPRSRAYPSSSPSPSSYRSLWDRRYTLRRSTRSTNTNTNTNSNSNGSGSAGGDGSSLWRSLSFAAARHKKVLPPLPPLAINSPTMTVVTSVTSEVLPSYLPSPQFDSPGADQVHMGQFGFENVPLSPPLPPPLHTRKEAADPDDSRMKELRGVYEAVARALGSTHGV